MSISIHPSEARRRFAELARGEVGHFNLAEGALLIALEEYPNLDVDASLAELDSIASKVRERSVKGEPAIFTLGHMQAVLFEELGFSGDGDTYYDVRNSYLNEVLDHRRGLPITLSIIVLDVAHRLGLDVVGVGLPGHYLVKARFDLSEVYLDPFYGGRTLTVPEIGTMLSEMSGGQVQLRSEFLRAWSARDTLIRVLTNLQAGYARINDARRALAARERIAILREGVSQ